MPNVIAELITSMAIDLTRPCTLVEFQQRNDVYKMLNGTTNSGRACPFQSPEHSTVTLHMDPNDLRQYPEKKKCSLVDIQTLRFTRRMLPEDPTERESIWSFVSHMTRLVRLDLTLPLDVTDADLSKLLQFTNLQQLHVGDCKNITDAGMQSLSMLENMTELKLDGCPNITDAGVGSLSVLKNLQQLDLSDCNNITCLSAKASPMPACSRYRC